MKQVYLTASTIRYSGTERAIIEYLHVRQRCHERLGRYLYVVVIEDMNVRIIVELPYIFRKFANYATPTATYRTHDRSSPSRYMSWVEKLYYSRTLLVEHKT